MNKICLLVFLIVGFVGVTACSPNKPPLEPTQIVNGKSIVTPPEFFVLPKEKVQVTNDSKKEKN